MTVRDIDPAFSDDLRRELVARSNAASRSRNRPHFATPVRRQLLTSIVTAVVLLLATLAVLQVTRPTAQPAAPDPTTGSGVVDPLEVITDPSQGEQFLSRSPDVLLHRTGTDRSAHSATLAIPSDVTTVRIWLNCTDGAHFAVSLPRSAKTGTCASSDATPLDARVQAGSRITIHYAVPVPADASYALVVVALPAR